MRRTILVRRGRSSHLPATWFERPAHGGNTAAEPTVSRMPRSTMLPVPPDHDVIAALAYRLSSWTAASVLATTAD
jgi:hypothetical protein